MNVLPVILASSTVPVPDLGPSPDLYTTTPLAAGLLILGALGVIVFTAQVLGVRRRADTGGSVLAPFLFTLVPMVVPLAAGVVLIETGKDRAMDRIDAYDARAYEAWAAIVPQIEAQYGVTIENPFNVPTDDGRFGAVDLTLADGTRRGDCMVVTDGTYEIRCGSTRDPAETTPLPLADPPAAP